MATLLCSLLIGNGFRTACVVSGYATLEVANNDQRRVDCPYIPEYIEKQVPIEEPPINKYSLKNPPDMRSKFLLEIEENEKKQLEKESNKILDEKIAARKLLEILPLDSLYGKRVHAWVTILLFADPDDPLNFERIPLFIEPSTGFSFLPNDNGYLGIESTWNPFNYYFNRQVPISNISNMKWNFQNTDHWEHMLPGEPVELRMERPLPDDKEGLTQNEIISKEKHLDMPNSWVNQLHIGNADFEERYPNGEKLIHFKRVIYERFSPYRKRNGLVTRLTTYESLEYEQPLLRWEWYKNRKDFLQVIKINFTTKQLEEYFSKGRPDNLKYYNQFADNPKQKIFKFYSTPRVDALIKLEIDQLYFREYYGKRNDLLYFREFKITDDNLSIDVIKLEYLEQIVEKFNRNITIKDANRDIAKREFNFSKGTIFVQFHYAHNAITSSTRTFVKPPKPDYGCETIFVSENTQAYNCSPTQPDITQVEQYLLLLDLLNAEEEGQLAFKSCINYIQLLLETRNREMSTPYLSFSIFDSLRNDAPRKLRLATLEEQKEREEHALRSEPDFVAPYLVYLVNKMPDHNESEQIYNDCLLNIKKEFLELLNDLQRKYDDHVSESLHFKRFLNNFQDQFDDFDYDRLIKQGQTIEINKRTIQQRLITTKMVSDEKYEKIKQSILKDPRLNFADNFLPY